VPANQADAIFEPFHSGFEGGTGLGLATCYSVIEAHDGKIWVEGGSSGGACFVIQLPRGADLPAASSA
jgi:two-component system sensor histidine kinase PilS (NtrC family)